jgi:hypothetical protein
MKRVDYIIHGTIALAWVGLALGISLKIAVIGNESAAIAKQRGADFKTRTDLIYKQERLRVTFEKEACVPALEQLVRTLNLPIQPPVMTAYVSSPGK